MAIAGRLRPAIWGMVMLASCGMSFGQAAVGGNEPAIVPRPAEMKLANGVFRLASPVNVRAVPAEPETLMIAALLSQRIRAVPGLKKPGGDEPAASRPCVIELRVQTDTKTPADDASYELTLDAGCTVAAVTHRGLFHGVQTLLQLIDGAGGVKASAIELPRLTIRDAPRYRHRGMLLDCGRHFMPVELIKRYIDLLAYHKMNVLHWHLTEDQGWRIEIKKYPTLTQVGAWREATRPSEQPRDAQGRYGGFYTQAQIREIVAYAKSRYITVIPEIEMPGHALAALASYPELSCTGGPFKVGTQWGVIDDVYCAGNDKTFEFLEGVLSEVIELFDAPYIHIGGDECPKARWEKCAKCQARMKAEGLKTPHELQSYFIRRIEKFLNARGRRVIGWDEILEGGLAPNATVQSWRGLDGAIAAASSGHDVISSPTSHCYLDYAQFEQPGEPTQMGFIPLERVYEFEPTPPGLTAAQARHVLGLEGNLWTEHAPPARVDWQSFPRLCAIAEVGWSPKSSRDWKDFQRRMTVHYRRLDGLGVKYFVPPKPGTATAKPGK